MFEDIQYKEIFQFFQEISQIPHGSGNEEELSNYVKAFAEGLSLEVYQDAAYNLLIRKPGSAGREAEPSLLIQGHLDMVCEKDHGSPHNFETDPIALKLDGDWLFADRTTLGGDDGIAVAYAMALMSDTTHSLPPLEILLTTGEETGLLGANYFDTSQIRSKRMINLDSEKEGTVLISSAGGAKLQFHTRLTRSVQPDGYIPVTVRIYGLKGGHSGEDINKKRGSANKLMSRYLFGWYNHCPNTRLVSIDGGVKDNAIPRECTAKLWVPGDLSEEVERGCWWFGEDLAKEFGGTDSQAKIALEWADIARDPEGWSLEPCSNEDTGRILSFLNLAPDGVQNMSHVIEGLVETSCNLGILRTDEDIWTGVVSLRGSQRDQLLAMKEKFYILSGMNQIEMQVFSEYPGWEYREESALRQRYCAVYQRLFGKEAGMEAIHAGLECGIFAKAIPDLDIISIGPDIVDIHSPSERMSVSSVQRTWELLLAMLEQEESATVVERT